MSNSTLANSYQADVERSLASLKTQMERTHKYVNSMHVYKNPVGKYVRNVLSGLLDGFEVEVLTKFKDTVVNKNPIKTETELQKAYTQIQLITTEWNRISEVIYSVRTNYKDVELFAPIIAEAQKTMRVTTKEIINENSEENKNSATENESVQVFILPCIAGPLSVTSFRYLENLKILNIPVTIAYSPWEWSIFWHEIAGELRINNTDRLKTAYASISNPDEQWSQDWFNELYEDAFSVLSFGIPFIDILHRILSRVDIRITGDDTHPSREIRVRIACALLRSFNIVISISTCPENLLSDFEKEVVSQLHKILEEDEFKPINRSDSLIIDKIRETMERYSNSPDKGELLYTEMEGFISGTPFTYPEAVTIKPREMSTIELSSGIWHKHDWIFSARGINATLTTGNAIVAYRYELASGAGGWNAITSNNTRINASWYRDATNVA